MKRDLGVKNVPAGFVVLGRFSHIDPRELAFFFRFQYPLELGKTLADIRVDRVRVRDIRSLNGQPHKYVLYRIRQKDKVNENKSQCTKDNAHNTDHKSRFIFAFCPLSFVYCPTILNENKSQCTKDNAHNTDHKSRFIFAFCPLSFVYCPTILMDLPYAIIYGIVEGITEFLPISSTGHLMLTTELLGVANTEFIKTFEVVIQLGAIASVIALYPRRLFMDRSSTLRVAAGFLPTALLGLLFYPVIKSYLLDSVTIVLVALFLGGVFILWFEKRWKPGTKLVAELSLREAATIGVLQALAFIPGVSRALATIFGGMWLGLSRKEAVEFSFLLAVPTMAAASALEIVSNYHLLIAANMLFLAVGFLTSFVVASLAIKFLLRLVATNDFTLFGVYRIAISLVLFASFYF